jgi:DNA mismatch repair ATPase MutS
LEILEKFAISKVSLQDLEKSCKADEIVLKSLEIFQTSYENNKYMI